MLDTLFIAVDLGAGSGRVFLCGIGADELSLEEIRRFHYPPRIKNGRMRWDFSLIFDEIKAGLKQATARAKELDRPIHSIGVDSWGVDYGLLDANGKLIDDPVCYRDDRTSGAIHEVSARIPRRSIFERTGIQFQNFNTLFQLWSEREDLKSASKLLLLPDLVNYFLTGKIAAEFTNATTTQMVNAATEKWDTALIDDLDLPVKILPDIISAGSDLGKLKPAIAAELGLKEVHVIAPGTHDTASAVAAAPISRECAYISSGTWSLVGVETDEPIINADVECRNFTNEGGVYGTTRFLKNVMGLWIFESCLREWKKLGVDLKYDDIISKVSDRGGFSALIFPDDPRFLNPPSMLDAMREQLSETGREFEDDPISISKMIFDSLAFRYASVLRSIESVTGRKIKGVQILGGGGRNRYLDQMTADASGLKVRAGLFEATVLGNVLAQAIAAGRFSSLADGREYVERNVQFVEFAPQTSREMADAAAGYSEIEARFENAQRST
ncbi:MAG TPA: rhamnulokinase family protein, partial [Pyrinomonadaceae bacterium]